MKVCRQSLAIIMLVFAANANAHMECLFNRYFFGIEFERQNYKAKDNIRLGVGVPNVITGFMKSWNNGYTFNVGYRFYDIGFRAGYTYNTEIKYYPTLYASTSGFELSTGYLTQTSDNIFIDGFYYFKYARRSEFKFMLGFGALRTKISSTLYTPPYNGYYFEKSFVPGFRVGVGSQYQLNNYLAADIIIKCQAPGNDFFNYMAGISIGLSAYF